MSGELSHEVSKYLDDVVLDFPGTIDESSGSFFVQHAGEIVKPDGRTVTEYFLDRNGLYSFRVEATKEALNIQFGSGKESFNETHLEKLAFGTLGEAFTGEEDLDEYPHPLRPYTTAVLTTGYRNDEYHFRNEKDYRIYIRRIDDSDGPKITQVQYTVDRPKIDMPELASPHPALFYRADLIRRRSVGLEPDTIDIGLEFKRPFPEAVALTLISLHEDIGGKPRPVVLQRPGSALFSALNSL